MSGEENVSRFKDVDVENKKLPPIGGYWNAKLVSLEEALQPVESLFNDLSRSIRMAKKHCTYSSDHNLTRDESAALYLYTMESGENSFYQILNAALRSENRPALIPWFRFLRLFDEALKKLPIVKGSIWRGVPSDVSGIFTKGQVFTWWGISSCSTSLEVIEDFLESTTSSTIFMIEAKQGRDVSAYSYLKGENEVLLNFGTELRVKSKTSKKNSGEIIVYLEELNDDVEVQDIKPKTSPSNNVSKYQIHLMVRWSIVSGPLK